MVKSPNRSVSILLQSYSCRYFLYKKRPLCHRASHRNDAQYLKFLLVFEQNVATVNHCRTQMYFIWQIYHGSTLVHNIIPFLFQTLVELVYLFLIMLEDELVEFIMYPLFLTERVFIAANAISRNGKYTDLCQYSLTVSEGELFQFICCLHTVVTISFQHQIR